MGRTIDVSGAAAPPARGLILAVAAASAVAAAPAAAAHAAALPALTCTDYGLPVRIADPGPAEARP